MSELSRAADSAHREFPQVECLFGEEMKKHTSFKIGGAAACVFLPESFEDMKNIAGALRELGVSPIIVGNGTNLLADDGALDIAVIKTSKLCDLYTRGENEIFAQCGTPLSRLAMFACENELTGAEFAHGIPGTVGGAVLMNAGAYGGEMASVIKEVTFLTRDLEVRTVSAEESGFSYRHSRFIDSGEIILSAVFGLSRGDAVTIKSKMEELSKKRRESQPLNLPSAGSTFKRPKNGYAAAMIDDSGLKGFSVGGAQVSEKHAGFVVNVGKASFSDVISVMEHVRETVLEKHGVLLEPEVRIISDKTFF